MATIPTWRNIGGNGQGAGASLVNQGTRTAIEALKGFNPFNALLQNRKDDRLEAERLEDKEFKRGSDLLTRELTQQGIDAGEFTAANRGDIREEDKAAALANLLRIDSGINSNKSNIATNALNNRLKTEANVRDTNLRENEKTFLNTIANIGTDNLGADDIQQLRLAQIQNGNIDPRFLNSSSNIVNQVQAPTNAESAASKQAEILRAEEAKNTAATDLQKLKNKKGFNNKTLASLSDIAKTVTDVKGDLFGGDEADQQTFTNTVNSFATGGIPHSKLLSEASSFINDGKFDKAGFIAKLNTL